MKKITAFVVFALLSAFVLASCNQAVKGGTVKNEAEWEAGFETLVNPHGTDGQAMLVSKADGDMEKITATAGFKSQMNATASVDFILNGESKSSAELQTAIVGVLNGKKAEIMQLGATEQQFQQLIEGIQRAAEQFEALSDIGDSFGVDVNINFIATPTWEVQYTANGKNADVERDEGGNITSYTPAVMVNYLKGGNEYWVDRNDNEWGTWSKTLRTDATTYEAWQQIFAYLQTCYDAIGNGPDSDGKYTVTLYFNPKSDMSGIHGFADLFSKEKKTDDDIEVKFDVWFGEEENNKKVKKLSIGTSSLVLDMGSMLFDRYAAMFASLLQLSYKVTMSLDMDIEYPETLEYEVPALLAEMK